MPLYLPEVTTEQNCSEVIPAALDDTTGANCPVQQVLLGCFQVQQDAWIDLVGKCDLFSDGPNCYATGVTGSACQRPAVGSQTWLTSGTQKWRPTQYLYGTGFVPNNGELWRNTLPQVDRRHRRSLLGEGEGSAALAGGNGGCFPDLYTVEDFKQWLDGSYQEPLFGGNSINPLGVIFWVLHAVGIIAMSAL
eukprot:jgi/Astpho2/4724/fgenesh1_pg.00067_%23_197_t